MSNRIRPYAWGSRTALAELLGEPSPSAHPQAELWIGAHPGDPSQLVGAVSGAGGSTGAESLVDRIAGDPKGQLGGAAVDQFGARLPFLLKVLAAAEPLSLQAHPTMAQAKAGFAAEEKSGIDINAAGRNYKDASHKPELICALTEFHALCGFRDPERTVQLLAELGCPELDRYLGLLSGQPDEHGTRALFSSIISMPSAALDPLLDAVLAACVRRVKDGSEFAAEYRTTLELGERYPGDPGVLAALLMNRVTLQPDQALYLGAGNLHAYLSGTGVEIMANSDNVLRGGLTPKHVDVPELMRVLDFSVGPVPVIDPHPAGPGVWRYPTPAKEFALSKLRPDDAGPQGLLLDHSGPQVVLVTEGQAQLHGSGTAAAPPLTVPQGRSAWIAADESGARITGAATVFLATDGL